MKTRVFRFAILIVIVCLPAPAGADSALPYTVRSKSFNAWNTSVHGDIRTVGMSGAAIGLADTFIAGTLNPAGLAMTLDTADSNFASQNVHDGAIQGYAAPVTTNNFGASIALYPWGLSLGTVEPYSEGQIYTPPSQPGNGLELAVDVREFHFELARVFAQDKFSLGADFILGQAYEEINPLANPSTGGSARSLAVGGTLGGLYHLPEGILLGLSLSMPMHYAGDSQSQLTSALPGFLKPVEVPGRIGLGVGWIPNRFFRADLTTYIVGTTPNTALIRDESAVVGGHVTAEPRLGVAYNFIELPELRATVFLGVYHEVSRISDSPGRTHGTWGVELHPWLATIGWAMDTADSYQSYLASVGVDLIRVMSKLEIIPKPWRPVPAGVLPLPFRQSTEGLARPLDPIRQAHGDDLNPFKVGLGIPRGIGQVPQNISGVVRKTGDDLKETGQELFEAVKQVPGRLKNMVTPRPPQ